MPSPNSKNQYSYKYKGRVYPTFSFATRLHDFILDESGGLPGFKDEGALRSALEAPVRSLNAQDAYYTFFEKVAAMGYLVARNHPFHDGNKRTSLFLMLKTLEWNSYYPRWTQDAETIVISLLGAGYLEMTGLRHALILGCRLDTTDKML